MSGSEAWRPTHHLQLLARFKVPEDVHVANDAITSEDTLVLSITGVRHRDIVGIPVSAVNSFCNMCLEVVLPAVGGVTIRMTALEAAV